MNAPKPAVVREGDPAVAAFENAPAEPLTDEERIALEDAMAHPGPGVSSDELLERLRPKP